MSCNARERIITINGKIYPGHHYPYDELLVNQSFFVPLARSSHEIAVEMVNRRNKKNRGFFVTERQQGGTLVRRADPAMFLAPSSGM